MKVMWLRAHLFPSRLMKCGYCKLKCKSKSVVIKGVLWFVVVLPPLLISIAVLRLLQPVCMEELLRPAPLTEGLPPLCRFGYNDDSIAELGLLTICCWCCCCCCGIGISWERRMRFELCIFTANDKDVMSLGSAVWIANFVIVNEHNLETKNMNTWLISFSQLIWFDYNV